MSLLQRIFRRPHYDSDITQFIEQLKADKPDLEARQRPFGSPSYSTFRFCRLTTFRHAA